MMFGPINTDGIPTINDYAQAQRVFEKIKPWRGCGEHERPLGKRRDKHKMIVLLNNGDYAARLYNTDVVTYHKDGDISIKRYDTASTVEFANAVLPWELRTTMHLGQMWVCMDAIRDPNKWPHDNKVRHYLREGIERLRFRRVVGPQGPMMGFECVNVDSHMPAQRKLLDTERAKQIREMLRPFEQWAKAVIGLNGGYPPQDTKHWLTVRELFTPEPNPEHYPAVLNHYNRRDWHRHMRVMQPNWINKLRDDAYKHFSAFRLEECPITELPSRSKWGIK